MTVQQLAAMVVLATLGASASAQVVHINARSAFESAGQIAYTSNFEDFGSGYNFPGDPYTRGDVTYTSRENMTVGAATNEFSIGKTQTVMSNNYWTPLSATVNTTPRYTLLAFDAAISSGLVSITVQTNQRDYTFSDLALADGSSTLSFEGFKTTGAGEYITGFHLDAKTNYQLAGITNVSVGVAAVPEPTSVAMLLAGMALVGVAARRRQHS